MSGHNPYEGRFGKVEEIKKNQYLNLDIDDSQDLDEYNGVFDDSYDWSLPKLKLTKLRSRRS